MKTIVVGGNFGETPKESSIVKEIGRWLACDVVNGGTFEDIKDLSLKTYDLIIWMPNIDNSFEKVYPKKDIGAILICSKVSRGPDGELDAIARIFKMHGNSVILIESGVKPFIFKLIDALGNVWVDTSSIDNLMEGIEDFVGWTSWVERKRCVNVGLDEFDFSEHKEFVEVNKQLADKFEITNTRFFGNSSTRCTRLFPTMRKDQTHMIVSRRNVDKKRITTDDLVLTTFDMLDEIEGEVSYYGNWNVGYYGANKPSVDTPIQLRLYDLNPGINYMIHGHTYVKGAPYTESYYPCGDMRELSEIMDVLKNSEDDCVINLKNHGFLMIATTLEKLKEMADNLEFEERNVGFEKVDDNLLV